MKSFSYLIISIALLICGQTTFAQSDISMTTQWNNRASYNPASISRTEYLYLFGNARRQWVGIDGAPTVVNIQASEYVADLNSAFGISMISDNIGLTSVLNPSLSYAYRISPNVDLDSWSLSFGLSAGVFYRSINGSQYDPTDGTDPSINYTNQTSTSPDANFGMELQTRNFIFGLSSTHLFAINKSYAILQNTNNRYGYAIYKYTNSDYYNLSFGLQFNNRNNLTVVQGSAMIRFKQPTGLYEGPRELFDVGLNYTSSKQLALLLGMNINKDFRIGYAYEYSFQLNTNQSGTHEIMLEYRIPMKISSICESCKGSKDWYF